MAQGNGGAGRKGNGKGELRLGRGRGGAGEPARAQMRRWRKKIWTVKRKAEFLDVLKATCNVQEACRAVDMSKCGVYALRRRDAGFAAAWKEAVEQGYSELEMLLLRQSIHGVETTETLDDGQPDGRKRVKTVHSYPHAIALRLFLAHRQNVDAYREEQGIERPGSDTVRAEIERRFAAMRAGDGGEDAEGGEGPEERA